MKVLIVEDEKLAAERLEELIKQYDTGITIAGPLDTVQETHNTSPPTTILTYSSLTFN
jgi:DNA-binding LytR/AlgR family response regulator